MKRREEWEDLAQFLSEDPPDKGKEVDPPEPWWPDLNPTQRLAWEDKSENILLDAEKASGKTVGALHSLVRHCYEADGALAMVVVTNYNVGLLGIWHDLESLVLPAWRDGNRHPQFYTDPNGNLVPHPMADELADDGIGLEFTNSQLDPKTKASRMWIRNMHGSWSQVILISIPFAKHLESKVKGISPSFVLVDELTNCESRAYHSYITSQMGRRRKLKGVAQQYVATCNPAGPSHWTYKLWFEECLDPNGVEGLDGLKRRPTFKRYHIPIQENLHRLPAGYLQRLKDAFGHDPIELSRLLDGVWVDRPDGTAIFVDVFVPSKHVKGEAHRSQGLIPHSGHTIVGGWDPGPVNFSYHMMQFIPFDGRVVVYVFDELNFVGLSAPYHRIVPVIMRRRWFWMQKLGEVTWEDIADEAAFNQLNTSGSYDHKDIEALSKKWVDEHKEVKLPQIKLKAAPKGNDSVPTRARILGELFQTDSILISATCAKTIEMLLHLESEEATPGKYDPLVGFRPKSSRFKHPFDSLTYPIFSRMNVTRKKAPERHCYEAGRG